MPRRLKPKGSPKCVTHRQQRGANHVVSETGGLSKVAVTDPSNDLVDPYNSGWCRFDSVLELGSLQENRNMFPSRDHVSGIRVRHP